MAAAKRSPKSRKAEVIITPKRIAPKLASGESRVGFGHGLPEAVKEGLRSIARQENKSMSWVMEEVIVAYFGLDKPEYAVSRAQLDRDAREKKERARKTAEERAGRSTNRVTPFKRRA